MLVSVKIANVVWKFLHFTPRHKKVQVQAKNFIRFAILKPSQNQIF